MLPISVLVSCFRTSESPHLTMESVNEELNTSLNEVFISQRALHVPSFFPTLSSSSVLMDMIFPPSSCGPCGKVISKLQLCLTRLALFQGVLRGLSFENCECSLVLFGASYLDAKS